MPSLRELRTAQLLTIHELAARAQVAPSTIYLIEAGRSIPRFSVARRLATALGVEPASVEELRRAIEQAQRPRATRRAD